MGAAARRGRPRHRAPTPTPAVSPPRSAIGAGAPRGGAGRRRPSPCARRRPSSTRCGRRPAGTTLSELLDPHGSDADHRRHARARRRHAPSRPGRCRRSGSGRSPTACCRSRPGGCRRTWTRRVDLNLHRYSGMLRSMWDEQLDRVPRLGRAGETRRRRRRDARPAAAHPGAVGAALAGDGPAAAVVGDRLAGHVSAPGRRPGSTTSPTGSDIPPDRPARFQYLTATADSHPLGVPLVAKGDAGTSYVAEIAALARQGDEGRRELNLRQNSIALLEALLAFAAVQELDKAASAELVDGLTAEDRAAAGFVRRGVRTPDLVRVEEPDPQRLPMQFASARALAAQTAPGSQVAVHDQVATRLRQRRAARAHRPAGEPGQRARPVPRRARRARGGTGRRAGVGVPGRARPVQLAHRRLVHVASPPPASTSCGPSGRRASTSDATAGSRTSGPTAVRPPTAWATSPRRRWRTP